MKVVRTKEELRKALATERVGRTVGLVPTMGYLHEGHLSLLRAAEAECDVVTMSLFVNPTQFRPGEDLETYPRDEERDLALAAEVGTDLVYVPTADDVYPPHFATKVSVSDLTEVLCGDPRRRGSGHFGGVTTVVAKLFNRVQPDVAYFGQKDAQQAAVIRRMTADLDFPIRISVLPTIREADGLAMSSRNAYLGPEDRKRAVALSEALRIVEETATSASLFSALEAGRRHLNDAQIEVDYLEARDPNTLTTVDEVADRPVLIAVAAQVGDARLIDNVVIGPKANSTAE